MRILVTPHFGLANEVCNNTASLVTDTQTHKMLAHAHDIGLLARWSLIIKRITSSLKYELYSYTCTMMMIEVLKYYIYRSAGPQILA